MGKLLVFGRDRCVEEIVDCVLGSDEDGKCLVCAEGFAMIGFLCVRGELENCRSYFGEVDFLEVFCEECEDGFFREDEGRKCTKSLVSNCKVAVSLRKCTTCKDEFILFEQNNYDYCYPMDSDYYCKSATISNNVEYGASIKCNSCQFSNDIIVSDIGESIKSICLVYHKSENCKTHSVTQFLETSSFHCIECEDGYFYDQNAEKCTQRKNKLSDCITYNKTEDKCSVCTESTFQEDLGKKCKTFPIGIVGCINYTSPTTCTNCTSDMYLSNKTCQKIPPANIIKNCVSYKNIKTCKTCKQNYFLSSNTCTKTNLKNCTKPSSLNNCEICNPHHTLLKTETKTDCIPNNPKCQTHTPLTFLPCLKCSPNHYPSTETGKCVQADPLIPDCILYKNNSECLTCALGAVLGFEGKRCLRGGFSEFIAEGCERAFESEPFCVVCAAGFFLREGVCLECGIGRGCFGCGVGEGECFVCESGFWMGEDGVCRENLELVGEIFVGERDWVMRVSGFLSFFVVLIF